MPLLTNLCTTCHDQPPRYKCPACGAQSCSLACTRRHKARNSCSGIRDVTKFVPAKRLRTPAGVDHDFNFLRGIELARERSEKLLVEERGAVTYRELRIVPGPKKGPPARWGGNNGSFDSGGGGGDEAATPSQRRLRGACLRRGVEVLAAPAGMSRHRENRTSVNKRTRAVFWQVEWLVYEHGAARRPTRVLHKAMEKATLCQSFAETMDWLIHSRDVSQYDDDDDRHDEERLPRKKKMRKTTANRTHASVLQKPTTSEWQYTPHTTQNPFSTAWGTDDGSATVSSWARDADLEEKRRHQYFLLRPRTNPRELVPLDPTETMAAALVGRTVMEFPTIYVLPPRLAAAAGEEADSHLPPGCVLGSTERRDVRPPPVRNPGSKKRRHDEDSDDADEDVLIKEDENVTAHNLPTPPEAARADRDDLVKQLAEALRTATGVDPVSKKRRVAFAGIEELDEGEIVESEDGAALEGLPRDLLPDESDTSSEGGSSSPPSSEDDEDEEEDDDEEDGDAGGHINGEDISNNESKEVSARLNVVEATSVTETGAEPTLGKSRLVMYDSDSDD